MRILLLNDDFPKETPNSVAMIVRDLATAYRARGHETHILTTHRPSQSREILRGDGVTSLPSGYRPSLRHWLSLWRPAMSRMVSQEIAHFRPDAVHAHNLHIHLTFDALRQARRHTAQVLLTLHDAMAFAEGRIATARYLDHEDPKLSFADRIAMVGLQYNPLRNPFIRRMINRNATKTVAVSAAVAQAAERHGLQDVGVVHNAVDLREWGAPEADAAAFREQHGLGGRKVVLFAGRLREEKGVIALARAIERLRKTRPETVLVIVGEEARWHGLARESNLPEEVRKACVPVGWLTQKNLRVAYAACDVVAVPSIYLDPFVLVNLEAMASGKPVVGTRFGGTPEIVRDGETGFIVDPRDTDAFATALGRVLADPQLAACMGTAGRTRAEAEFAPNRQVEAYLSLLGADAPKIHA